MRLRTIIIKKWVSYSPILFVKNVIGYSTAAAGSILVDSIQIKISLVALLGLNAIAYAAGIPTKSVNIVAKTDVITELEAKRQ